MKSNRFKLAAICCALFSTSALANTTCTGTVQFAGLNPASGLLLVNYGYGVQYHCKVGETWNDVPAESCRAFYSMLLSAQLSGKRLQASYNDDFTCSRENLGDNEPTKHLLYRAIIVD